MSKRHFDVVVIGGGIYGACVAWDAALRGGSVALVDKGDFGGATSADSHKIIHGGLRYLQHGDLRRMRESARERRILMRIAPQFVHPLPFFSLRQKRESTLKPGSKSPGCRIRASFPTPALPRSIKALTGFHA
jgi:glycerol-3-phosphate dehydrogenase